MNEQQMKPPLEHDWHLSNGMLPFEQLAPDPIFHS
jgi:hypothetical protein